MHNAVETQRTPPSSHAAAMPVPQGFLIQALHLFGLNSLVIAQAFYERLASQPPYLVDPRVTPEAICGVVLIVSIGWPLLFTALVALAGLCGPAIRQMAYSTVLLALGTVMALLLLGRVMFLPSWGSFALALGASSGWVWAYFRFADLRRVVTVASLGIVVFPAILWFRLNETEASIAHQASRTESYRPVPVVMIVFDEFCGAELMTPEREIDEVRFPHFAELRNQSTWYRNAGCVSPTTIRALPAILSGRRTRNSQFSSPTTCPQNLFTLLAAAGNYRITAFEPLSVLAPANRNRVTVSATTGAQQALAVLSVLSKVFLFEITPADLHPQLPVIPNIWFGHHDSREVNREARQGTFRYGWTDQRDVQLEHFLECVDETPQSVLYFAHLLIPHSPWCFFPSGTRYSKDRDSLDHLCLEEASTIMTDELGVIQNQQRHLLQIMYVDQMVGRITQRLKDAGIWNECLLIVTADHGIAFRRGENRREFTSGNTEDILSVPLFVKYPGQLSPASSDLPAQSIDLLPTILEVVGIHAAAPLDGVSLRGPELDDRQQYVVLDASNDFTFPVGVLRDRTVPDLVRKRFGDPQEKWSLFRIGPHSEWLGQPLQSHPVNPAPPLELECQSEAMTSPSTEIRQFPYYIQGRVFQRAESNQPTELVAVVDGIICGTTRTYQQFGYTDRWSMMLPEWCGEDENQIPQFYHVEADGQTLSPCTIQWVATIGDSSQ